MGKVTRILSIVMSAIFMLSILPEINILDVKADDTQKIYEIRTVEDLRNIEKDMNGIYYLKNDIDLTEATKEGGKYDYNGRGWKPIEGIRISDSVEFTGIFYGENHKITGMRIQNKKEDRAYDVGLFNTVKGTVRDLSISGKIEGTINEREVGAIAGYVDNGQVINCHSDVEILIDADNGKGSVGGIIGIATGSTISHCSYEGNLNIRYTYTGNEKYRRVYAGGICGSMNSGKIEKTYNAGSVTAEIPEVTGYIGGVRCSGIVGEITYRRAEISDCYNSGKISGVWETSNYYGGSDYAFAICCGGDDVHIERAYNVGNVDYVMWDKQQGENLTKWCYSGNFGNYNETNNYYLDGTLGPYPQGAKKLTEEKMKTKSLEYYETWSSSDWIIDDETPYKYPQLKENRQVTNKEIDKIEIAKQDDVPRYYIGTSGIKNLDKVDVNIYYTNGEIYTTNCKGFDYELESENVLPGNSIVKLYPDKKYNPSKYVFVPIVVSNIPKAKTIKLISYPDKTEFYQDTELDFTGCKAEVTYDNGEKAIKYIPYYLTTGGNIKVSGKQTITYKEDDASVSFDIYVIPKKITDISIVSKPKQLEYYQYDKISLTGIRVKVTYNNGEEVNVYEKDLNVTYDFSTPGLKNVVVSYENFTDSFEVNVIKREATKIEIISSPKKTTYIQGQKIETDGMVVRATYNNGKESEITDYTVDMPTMTVGLQTVAVRYENVVTYIQINVIERKAEAIEIAKKPNKTTYIEGEEFDPTGLIVKATFNDGKTEKISDYKLSNTVLNTVGSKSIVVSYGNLFKTFNVEIIEKTLLKITIEGKNSYLKGEKFNSDNLIVRAVYDNGTSEEIKDFQVVGFTGNVGDNVIKVSYKDKDATFIITVHDPDDKWTIVKNATCTKEGEKVKYCKECGEIVCTEKIDKLPHTIVIDNEVPQTCTSTGLTQGSHCAVCNEIIVKQEIIPMHTESKEWVKVKDPTCTEEGVQAKKCTICGQIMKTKSIEAKGHNIVIDEAVNATCTKSGLTEGSHCTVCDEIIVAQKTVAALGHKYANFVHKSATCTEPEVAVGKCERCDSTKTAKISEALGHYYVTDKKVEPTCTKSGLTEGSHCSRCGLVKIKQEEIPATGHSVEKDWELEKKASCVQKGLKVKKCEKCDEVLESEEIEALGHDIVKDEAVEPTCSKDGLTEGEHCSRCGEILIQQKRIDALGHNIVKDEGTESTCDRKGITDGSHCDRCGEIIVRQIVIPTKTHTIIEVDSTPATYFENGYTGNIVCKVCGEQIRCGNIIPKLKLNKPTLKVKALKNKAVIKIGKIKGITKYEIRYKQGKKWIKKYTKKTTYTLKKLHSKKKVTIRVRAVVQDKSKVLYSKYCSKKVRVR